MWSTPGSLGAVSIANLCSISRFCVDGRVPRSKPKQHSTFIPSFLMSFMKGKISWRIIRNTYLLSVLLGDFYFYEMVWVTFATSIYIWYISYITSWRCFFISSFPIATDYVTVTHVCVFPIKWTKIDWQSSSVKNISCILAKMPKHISFNILPFFQRHTFDWRATGRYKQIQTPSILTASVWEKATGKSWWGILNFLLRLAVVVVRLSAPFPFLFGPTLTGVPHLLSCWFKSSSHF